MPMSPRLLRPGKQAVPLWIAAGYGVTSNQDPYWRENGLVFVSTDGASFWNIGDERGVNIPSEGINDPTVLQWRGAYYMCYGGGGGEAGKVGTRFIAVDKSINLIDWERVVSFGGDDTSGGIAVPTWVVDAQGPAIIGINDPPHSVVCLRPPSEDPATWGGTWSSTLLKDATDTNLNQGNTFVVYKDGTYYMAYNDVGWDGYKKRTSTSLTTGWSASSALGISDEADNGDSLTLVLKEDGGFRFHASNGNSLTGDMWYWDSADFSTWGEATPMTFVGADEEFLINWVHISRVKVSASLYARLLSYAPPPPPPPPPPAVSLLLNFDTSFDDASENDYTVTDSGATISTSTKKYGAGAGYFDGDSSLSIPSGANVSGDGDWTIEFWIYISTAQDAGVLVSDSSGGVNISCGYGGLRPFVGVTGVSIYCLVDEQDAISEGQWHHIAATQSSDTTRIFIDGVLKQTASHSSGFATSSATIGRNAGETLNGYVDDFRIVKGAAVYTGNFTPPTGPLSATL